MSLCMCALPSHSSGVEMCIHLYSESKLMIEWTIYYKLALHSSSIVEPLIMDMVLDKHNSIQAVVDKRVLWVPHANLKLSTLMLYV